MKKNLKIGIIHYRVGGTDGVSLEIDKRKKALKQMGHTVKLVAGDRINKGADYIIAKLEFDRPDVFKIRHNAFEKLEDFKNEQELMNYIYQVAEEIKQDFLEIHRKEDFDYLYLHNIFTHGRNIAAAKSFSEVLEETKIKGIAIDHDFYISYGNMYKTNLSTIKKYLNTYVPPASKKIKHITINSVFQKKLKDNWGHSSMIFPDTWDFGQKQWIKDKYNSSFLQDLGIKENDILALQATRIVERKSIELAMDVIKELQSRKQELVGQTLYNGKKITKNSDIIFLLSGYIEPASRDYANKLKKLAQENKIKAIFAENLIREQRGKTNKGRKIYSLWDSYVYSDFVTYPSNWEGWGNQFIEAVFAKKPIIVFEYPVFKADIKKEGYVVISLGDKIEDKRKNGLVMINPSRIKKASTGIIQMITSPKTSKILAKNFEIGKKYHGTEILKKLLKKSLEL